MDLDILPKNIFSFWLSMSTDIPSQLLFGTTDTAKYEGEIEYFPVLDK